MSTPAVPNPTPAPSNMGMPEVIKASQDTSHPQHHFALGQVLSTVLLGLAAYGAVQSGGSSVLSNPNSLAQFIQGFESIWIKPKSS